MFAAPIIRLIHKPKVKSSRPLLAMSLCGLSSEDMVVLLLLNRVDVDKFRPRMFVSMAGST
jgi:hypothetical protein